MAVPMPGPPPPVGFIIFVVLGLLQLLMSALRDYEATQLGIEKERVKHGAARDRGVTEYACVPDGGGSRDLRGVLKNVHGAGG